MIRSNLLIRRVATASNKASYAAGSTSSIFAAAAVSSSSVAAAASDALAVANYSTSSKVASASGFAFSSSFSSQSTNNTANRYFSSSSVVANDACTELGSILQREINEEVEAAIEHSGAEGKLPPELAELQSTIAKKWTILEGITGIGGAGGETGSGATVRLLRKKAGSKGAKIGIVFHCQDTEEDSKFDEEDMFDQEPQDEDDVEENAQAVRFGVVVSKGGKTVVLQCRCGYELNVDGVMVRDGDMESVLAQLAGGEGLHAALYQVRVICIVGCSMLHKCSKFPTRALTINCCLLFDYLLFDVRYFACS